MKRIMVFAVVLTMCVCGLAQDTNYRVTVSGSALVKGQSYEQRLDNSAISKLPSWDPFKEKCPLDPGKAAQLAVAKLQADIPSATHIKLESVSLHKIPSRQNKWNYMVNFFEKPDSSEGDYANVIVNLDGTIPVFVKEKKE